MKLVELIKQYRESHNLSQRQFAALCGLSNGYISMLERGENPATGKPITPAMLQLKKLAEGMHISVMELFDLVDDMPIDISEKTSNGKNIRLAENSAALKLNRTETQMIQKFRQLDDRGQAAVLNVLDHEYESLPGEKAKTTPKQA
ncbi:MAG: helix-turn-helix domain-containing protein [Faecousia sp.]